MAMLQSARAYILRLGIRLLVGSESSHLLRGRKVGLHWKKGNRCRRSRNGQEPCPTCQTEERRREDRRVLSWRRDGIQRQEEQQPGQTHIHDRRRTAD